MSPLIKFIFTPFNRGQSWQLCLRLYHSVCINSKLLICSGTNSLLGQSRATRATKLGGNQTNSGRSGQVQTSKTDECCGTEDNTQIQNEAVCGRGDICCLKQTSKSKTSPIKIVHTQAPDMQLLRQQTELTRQGQGVRCQTEGLRVN